MIIGELIGPQIYSPYVFIKTIVSAILAVYFKDEIDVLNIIFDYFTLMHRFRHYEV